MGLFTDIQYVWPGNGHSLYFGTGIANDGSSIGQQIEVTPSVTGLSMNTNWTIDFWYKPVKHVVKQVAYSYNGVAYPTHVLFGYYDPVNQRTNSYYMGIHSFYYRLKLSTPDGDAYSTNNNYSYTVQGQWGSDLRNFGFALDTWMHFAFVNSLADDRLYGYLNGQCVGYRSRYQGNLHRIGSTYNLSNFANSNECGNGNFSNFRISNVDRYNVGTGNFTPPVSPFSVDANTKLLVAQSSEIIDLVDPTRVINTTAIVSQSNPFNLTVMAIPGNTVLTLDTIRDEYEGPVNATSISQYYRGGVYVPNNTDTANIPTSGVISFSQFRNTRRWFDYVYILASGSFDTNFNLATRAAAAGWVNTRAPLRAFITINGVLGSNSVNTPGFDTGTGWATGALTKPKITLSIGTTGLILGKGGNWSELKNLGGVNYRGWGGDAVHIQAETLLTNSGIIAGGGGSGQPGSGGMYGGGSGYIAGTGVAGTPFTGTPVGNNLSGGYTQNDDGKAGNPNGGWGGGWVARAASSGGQALSTNGFRGTAWTSSPTAGNDQRPGTGLAGTSFLIFGSATGTIYGGSTTTVSSANNPPAGTLINTFCVGVQLWGTFANGSGGSYNQLIDGNSAYCGGGDGSGPTY